MVEHYGDRTTLDSTAWRSPDPKSGDRLEETLAAPQWHAKLIEVAVCETRQKLSIDFAVAKGGLILTETKAAEPSPDIDDRIRPTRDQWSAY